MTEVPKIVYDRLRAALPLRGPSEPMHPDADLLTAFAEQALPVTERNDVLEHLAFCGDCREVVALALPDASMAAPIAADTETAPATVTRTRVSAPHGLSFAWPSLRWAALAAGVAVIAAVLLVRSGKPPVSTQQIASLSVPLPAVTLPTDQSAIPPKTVATKTDTARTKSELMLSKKVKAGQSVPSPQGESGMLLADNKADNKQDAGRAGNLSAASSARSQAFAYNAQPGQDVNKSVGVYGLSSEDTLMARNDAPAIGGPPIEKAKPAPPETEVDELRKTQAMAAAPSARLQARSMMSAMKVAPSASQTLDHNVMWALKEGALQRSLDRGQSWQSALRADHLLLCYVSHGTDVWTGGQAGILFHSVDGGVTWLQVQPSFEARELDADITHIDLTHDVQGDVAGRTQVALSTSNNEMWSSVDGGKTWTKKTAEKK